MEFCTERENLVWLKGQRPPSEHLFRLSIEQVDVWTDDVESGPDEGRWVNSQLTNVDSSVFPLDIMNFQPAKKKKISALMCSYEPYFCIKSGKNSPKQGSLECSYLGLQKVQLKMVKRFGKFGIQSKF